MSLPSRNLYKCKQVACSVIVACLYDYPFFLCHTLLLPVYFLIPFIYTDAIDWLLLNLLCFYTNVVATFLFIRCSCKQTHYFRF